MSFDPPTSVPPRWLHGIAILTVLFTLPLLFLGAGVTSHGVGMIDPRGFRPPWEIVNGLFENSGLDWRLEYGHRTFGFLVGVCAIVLAVGCWFCDARPLVGWLAFLALGLICIQGTLGILRVDLNAQYGRSFALVHGIFAQIVFAVLACLTMLLSPRWSAGAAEPTPPAFQRASLLTVLLVFVQLVLGGMVRHEQSIVGPRGHLLGAFVIVGAVVWLLKLMRESGAVERFRVQRILLMAFLTIQLLLGVESWLAKFFVPQADFPQLQPFPMHGEWIRTLHYVIGACFFTTTVSIAVVANFNRVRLVDAIAVRRRELEAAL